MGRYLNGLDWQILGLLRDDGRMTISQLAKKLNRSRSTISEHVEKLKDSGVLQGVSAVLDEEKLGFGLSAFVRLQAGSANHRQIVNEIADMPEVSECHVLAGTDLLLLRVVARDMAHLRDLVDGFTRFGSTQTDVIFSTVKQQLRVNSDLYRKTTGYIRKS